MPRSHPWGSNPHFTREEKDRFQRRRIAVFDAGVAAALEGRIGAPRLNGEYLGSAECVDFFNGMMSVIPGFDHPYGSDLADPHRPAERANLVILSEQERLAIKAWREALRSASPEMIPAPLVMGLVYAAAKKIRAAAELAETDHRRSLSCH